MTVEGEPDWKLCPSCAFEYSLEHLFIKSEECDNDEQVDCH